MGLFGSCGALCWWEIEKMILLFFFGLCFFGLFGDCDVEEEGTEINMIIYPAGVENPTLEQISLMEENFQKFNCEVNPQIYRDNRTLSIEQLTSMYYEGKNDRSGYSIGFGHELDYQRCDNITDDMEQPRGKFVRFCMYLNEQTADCSDWLEKPVEHAYCRDFDGSWNKMNQEQIEVHHCKGMGISEYLEKFKELRVSVSNGI